MTEKDNKHFNSTNANPANDKSGGKSGNNKMDHTSDINVDTDKKNDRK